MAKAKKKATKKASTTEEILPELSERQIKFIACYLENGGNGTKAARDAGYGKTDNASNVQAQRLLRNATIQAFIALKRQELADRIDQWVITEESLLQRLAAHAYTTIGDIMGGGTGVDLRAYRDIDPKHLPAIKSVSESSGEGGQSMSVSMHDPIPAIDRIIKLLNLFPNAKGSKQDAGSGRESNQNDMRDALERVRNRFKPSADGSGSAGDDSAPGGG